MHAPDHLDTALAARAADRGLVTDGQTERPHGAGADGDLARPGRRPPVEHGETGRAGQPLEPGRADLADGAAGAGQVQLALVHDVDSGDTWIVGDPQTDLALLGGVGVDGDVPRLAEAVGVAEEADHARPHGERADHDGDGGGEGGEGRQDREVGTPAPAGQRQVGAGRRDGAQAQRRRDTGDRSPGAVR